MNPIRYVPSRDRLYVTAVVLLGGLVLIDGCRDLSLAPPAAGWLLLAVLTWISAAFAIKIPSAAATISVSEVFVFALVILFGSPAATVTVAVDGLISSIYRKNWEPRRLLFNVAEPALSIWVAGHLYRAAGGPPALSSAATPLTALVGPVLVLAVSFLMMNTWLTAAAVALEARRSVVAIWRSHIAWLSVNFLGGASIALLLSANMREVSLQGLLLVLPLVLILYLVFRNWSDRLRDAEAHVAAVDSLYLSTVEALAIAIESKDAVTHDHVRRVRTLALAIADRLGVTDVLQRRAIEAGALLHDIGKVAIPDYILHKPDKLTAAEYEVMKLHAPIGAEILLTVGFPYPVVPIVRHHHENWDGTGYPDRIAGSDIPMGARIISVVDCFDALTSDRPYRRALSEQAALDIVRARSGNMYDPQVVEALFATHGLVRPLPPPRAVPEVSQLIARANRRSVRTIVPGVPEALPRAAAGHVTPTATLDGFRRLLELAPPPSQEHTEVAYALAGTWLRAKTAAVTVCVSAVDDIKQVAHIVHASGHGEHLLHQRSVPLGEGITGWVAVNHSAIVNSDPALDFSELFQDLRPRLTAALSVPLGSNGVLTLYTDRPSGFDSADRAAAEEAADHLRARLAGPLREASQLETSPLDLNVEALLQASMTGRSVGVLSVVPAAGAAARDHDETSLAAIVFPALRLSDSLFVSARNEIVAVLPGCEPEAEPLIRSRLQAALDSACAGMADVAVGFAVTPRDGLTLASALKTAREGRRTLSGEHAGRQPDALRAVQRGRWT